MFVRLNYKSATVADFITIAAHSRKYRIWNILLNKANKKLYNTTVTTQMSHLTSIEKCLFLDAITGIDEEEAIIHAKYERNDYGC